MIAKSPIFTPMVTVWVVFPLVALIITVNEPEATPLAVTTRVELLDPPAVRLITDGFSDVVRPGNMNGVVTCTVPEKPLTLVMVSLEVEAVPAFKEITPGVALIVKSG